MDEIKLEIKGHDDRRTILGILAANGHWVKEEADTVPMNPIYYIVIQGTRKR